MKAVRDKKFPDPKTASFSTLRTFLHDSLAESKLAFAISLSKPLEKFLTDHQTDLPVIPFLYDDLDKLMRKFGERVLKDDAMKQQLDLVNFSDPNNFVEGSKVDVGVETKELLKKSNVLPRDLLDFRIKCRNTICGLITQLLTKSPLQYSLCKYMRFMDPQFVVSNVKGATNYLKRALISSEFCELSEVEDILDKFKDFCCIGQVKEEMLKFKRKEHRVDELYSNLSSHLSEPSKLWQFIARCLTLSHGQASVERGFSENKEALEVNMGAETLIARRIIKDHVRAVGGIGKLAISSKLRTSCCQSHQKYSDCLDQKKKENEARGVKRKCLEVEEEVKAIKKRKVEMEESISYLQKESDKISDKAAASKDSNEQLALFTSANALRKSVIKKEQELSLLKEELLEKEDLLRSSKV